MAKKTRGKSPAKKPVPARNGATVVRVKNRPLRDLTEEALQSYFTELNGHRPGDLYELVLGEIETPLFKTVLDYTGGNQSVAAEILGINRATLRKKLRQYAATGLSPRRQPSRSTQPRQTHAPVYPSPDQRL